MSKLDVDQLKEKYIGQEINWFTITDIFRDQATHKVMIKLKCRCGSEKVYAKKKVFGKHFIMSCGCHHNTEEYKQAHKMSESTKESISRKRVQYYLNHPEAKQAHSDRLKTLYEKEPDRCKAVGDRISNWYKENPDKVEQIKTNHSNWYKNNPEQVKEASNKRLKYLSDHPEVELARRVNISKWAQSHPEEVASIAEKNRLIAANKRANRNYEELIKFIHPDYIENLQSGCLKTGDIIKTKCPSCDEYAEHRFNSSIAMGVPPLCKECHVKFTSSFTSKYEDEIADIVSAVYSGECIRNNRDILDGKELDLYYPEKSIAIEFNGFYWHDDNHKPKGYHFNKFKQCKDKGIRLISIFEQDWTLKHDKLVSLIQDSFSDHTKIYARNCTIKEVSFSERRDFVNKHHFDGDSIQGTIAYGLYYNDELVSVMSFGKLRGQNSIRSNSDHFELVRFVTKSGLSIIGGASKLFTHFIREYNPKYILCYSDNDLFTGDTYSKLGFKLKSLGDKSIDYQWCNATETLSRQQCMLSKLLSKYPVYKEASITGSKEKFIMEDLGYHKIYRCGNSIWEYCTDN